MLYLLAHWLHYEGLTNLFRYQSFRAGASLLTALFVGLLIGPRFINMLRVRQARASRSARTGRKATSPSAARPPWAG